jgi:uncharacterized protein YbbC (DUF1343 family)
MARELDGIDETALHVVPTRGWTRELDFARTGLPWVLPSPNMPTLDTARVYPGGCLLEGTNLSEGRGATRPFEIWGAPFVDGEALAGAVSMPGVVLRPLTFQPTFHKHAMQLCGGVQVHLIDHALARPYERYLRMLAALRELAGEAFAWRTEPYEFVSDRPAIDLLTGGPELRELCNAGEPIDDWLEGDRKAAAEFAERRRAWLLY